MELTAVTITSDTKEDIIGDALRSAVDWVDEVLIVHMLGWGEDSTLQIAKMVCGDKLRVIDTPFGTPFADLRNLGLREANGDWAMILDTDERIKPNGMDVREMLEGMPESLNVLLVAHSDDSYEKERFFRLPFKGEFVGNIHEELRGVEGIAKLDTIRFDEPKVPNPAHYALHLAGLEKQIEAEPDCERWRYQRAVALELLGRTEEAIEAYALADQTGWVRFCVARCLSNLKRPEEAFSVCHQAMIEHPGYAEFPWMMGWQCLAMGKPFHALAWATMAESLAGQLVYRTGVREPIAYKGGPKVIMEEAKRIIREAM